MTAGADAQLVVLHTLRCCGASSTQRVDDVAAHLVTADVESVLLDLAGQGLVTHDGGTFGGWRLTDEGRAADAERIARELQAAGARGDVEAAYADFLPLNERVMDLCGRWQVRDAGPPMVLNDHTDRGYDAGVLARLGAVHADAHGICDRLAARLHRFSHYAPRLAVALGRARAGEMALVTDSLDSFHTVWFQLHEDLLVTLGRGR